MPFKRFITLVLTLLTLHVYGQKKNENYYLFDSAWKVTMVVAEAQYFARIKPVNDSVEQWDIYNLHGPLIRIETNKKGEDGDAHGRYAWYDERGFIDSLGHFTNGIRNGDWHYYNDRGKVTHRKEYVGGLLIAEEDYTKDSLREDEPLEDGEADSKFKGGRGAWQWYLEKNRKYPKEAMDRGIIGDVRIRFTVDVDGTVTDPWIVKSVELSLDDECMRLILKSPKWVPGMQDGKKIKTYKVQPIFFFIE
jgi:periplasmic protein TonB